MSTPVVKTTTKNRPVKVTGETWQSVSHESVDRRASIIALIAVAWLHFMQLPEARREKLVRDYEQQAA